MVLLCILNYVSLISQSPCLLRCSRLSHETPQVHTFQKGLFSNVYFQIKSLRSYYNVGSFSTSKLLVVLQVVIKREHKLHNIGVTQTILFSYEILPTTTLFFFTEITNVSHLTALIFSRNFLDSMFPFAEDISAKNMNEMKHTTPLPYEFPYVHDN